MPTDMSAHMFACMPTDVSAHMSACMPTDMWAEVSVCMPALMSACVPAHMPTHMPMQNFYAKVIARCERAAQETDRGLLLIFLESIVFGIADGMSVARISACRYSK